MLPLVALVLVVLLPGKDCEEIVFECCYLRAFGGDDGVGLKEFILGRFCRSKCLGLRCVGSGVEFRDYLIRRTLAWRLGRVSRQQQQQQCRSLRAEACTQRQKQHRSIVCYRFYLAQFFFLPEQLRFTFVRQIASILRGMLDDLSQIVSFCLFGCTLGLQQRSPDTHNN